MADVEGATFSEIVEKFVDPKFMAELTAFIETKNISIGTVHFSLMTVLVNDIVCETNSIESAAATLLGMQAYAYQCMSTMWAKKVQCAESKMEVN